MHATTVAVDLAKEIFELAFADADHQIVQRKDCCAARLAVCWKITPQFEW
jgi:hypothetical protein